MSSRGPLVVILPASGDRLRGWIADASPCVHRGGRDPSRCDPRLAEAIRDSHRWCSSWAGEPAKSLLRSTAHVRQAGVVTTATVASHAFRRTGPQRVDAIWSAGPEFLRGVAHGPSTRGSWDLVRRTRSRRSTVIRLTLPRSSGRSELPRPDPPSGAR